MLGFAWFGTDNDLPYRQYIRMEGGWLGCYNRIVPAAWWVMNATYIGHLFGDGFHWWHDQGPEGSDRKRRPDLVMIFLTWPFADTPEWNVKLRIATGQEREVKMHRQGPMLRVFSKRNPQFGL